MKSYIVIGLGKFGAQAARCLCQLGCEVLAMDTNAELVQHVANDVTQAVVADAKDKEVLKTLGAGDFECAIVAIGDDLSNSVLATMNLKELGVPYIVCKASDETHRQVLMKLGADKVVIPEMEHANRLDGITGLFNKTAFADTAQSLLASSPDSSAAFIFLDLDHLKEINDKLGHAMGDVAIIDAADTIQNIFRKTDLVGRFGGDEFCILLLDIPKSRFHECLEETKIKLRRTYSDRDIIVPVTASIGAVYAERVQNLSYDTLMQLADDAVYEAKASGRDRYILKEI